MKFYLSAYKFGNKKEELKNLLFQGAKVGVINNSRDFIGVDDVRKKWNESDEIEELTNLGFVPESLDLRQYFGLQQELKMKIDSFDAIWVSGGNVYVLRQAMKLSGLDKILMDYHNNQSREGFLYSGYSAGMCVLCDTLKHFKIVDESDNFPYSEINEPIWEGLGIFHHIFLPHYKSENNPETDGISIIVQNLINQKILFIALRDGEVFIQK